jgi:hypothetical protein
MQASSFRSPGGAQDDSPGRQPWVAHTPYPALKGRQPATMMSFVGTHPIPPL